MTEEIQSKFYFVYKKSVLEIDERTIIARKEGNVILAIDPKSNVLKCYIDEKSVRPPSNGIVTKVIVNDKELLVGEIVDIGVGDVFKIGIDEYKIFNSFAEADNSIPPRDRRRYKRPESTYAPSNLINFFCAPPWALGFYLAGFLFTLSRFVPYFHLELTDDIQFVTDFYNQHIVLNSLLAFGVAWLLSLLHSFGMYLYFNRKPIRQVFITIVYAVIVIPAVYMITLPMVNVRTYIQVRDRIQNDKYNHSDLAINQMRALIDDKSNIKKSFIEMKDNFDLPQQEILEKDLEVQIKALDKKIKG